LDKEGLVTAREERLAENEALFREVNQRISEIGTQFGSELVTVVCECATADCTERFGLSRADYSELRASSTRFGLVPGHERPDVERVVERRDGYIVVEKVGEGTTVAEQHDDSHRTDLRGERGGDE
jgi:hypothetical protein